MTPLPGLVGMVHLGPLPGSPGFRGSMDEIIEAAVTDAAILEENGFPALMVENFGDAPFFPDRVPPVTVAAMTRVMAEIHRAVDLPLGVNVLRNDALSAVAIAAATGASMVRVNVLTGTMFTDQGPIVGKAAEVARDRAAIASRIAILADVLVKHATPPAGLGPEQAALDTWERGGADALVVSGSGTGRRVDVDELRRVRQAVPGAPVLIGSGADPDTLATLVEWASGVIVGSSIKVDGRAENRVDPGRAERMAAAARSVGLV